MRRATEADAETLQLATDYRPGDAVCACRVCACRVWVCYILDGFCGWGYVDGVVEMMKITLVYSDGARHETDAKIEDDELIFTFPVSGDAVGIILPSGEFMEFESPISDAAYSENPDVPGAPTFYHLKIR